MQTRILHYIFLFNWHYSVEICFHFDVKEGFFVNFVVEKADLYWLWLIYKSNKRIKHPRGLILTGGTVFGVTGSLKSKRISPPLLRYSRVITSEQNLTLVIYSLHQCHTKHIDLNGAFCPCSEWKLTMEDSHITR